jgi:hypothetical protein
MLKTIAANVLLLVIVALVVAGVYALSLSLPVAAIAGAAAGALVKVDDARIKRERARRERIAQRDARLRAAFPATAR